MTSFILQNQFIVDDVSKIIKEAIENTIGGNAYQHDKGN
jgi:dynein light chain Tctex-type 1